MLIEASISRVLAMELVDQQSPACPYSIYERMLNLFASVVLTIRDIISIPCEPSGFTGGIPSTGCTRTYGC
jgi:hypothetical protein